MSEQSTSSSHNSNTTIVRSFPVRTIRDVLGTENMVEVGQQIIYNDKQYTLSEVELLDSGSLVWLLPDSGECFSVNVDNCF